MSRFVLALTLVWGISMSPAAVCADDRHEADIGGRAFVICASCHGQYGEGTASLGAPALAGQSAQYVYRQLSQFAASKRGTAQGPAAQMKLVLNGFPDRATWKQIADYVATLQPQSTALPSLTANSEAPSSAAQCTACHGEHGEGNPSLNAPRLAGLSSKYIAEQLMEFRAGSRGDDSIGAGMLAVARALPGDDVIQKLAESIGQKQ
jgi:cytochrome c553